MQTTYTNHDQTFSRLVHILERYKYEETAAQFARFTNRQVSPHSRYAHHQYVDLNHRLKRCIYSNASVLLTLHDSGHLPEELLNELFEAADEM